MTTGGRERWKGENGKKKKIRKSTNCLTVRRILYANLWNQSESVPTAILVKLNDVLHNLQISI